MAMRVQDLINVLKSMPLEMPVVFRAADGDYRFNNGPAMVETLDVESVDENMNIVHDQVDHVILCSDESWE
jgi:hypothetical protein